MELEIIHQDNYFESDEEEEEATNEKYFSIWDLWVGVGSRLLDDFTAALWQAQ